MEIQTDVRTHASTGIDALMGETKIVFMARDSLGPG